MRPLTALAAALALALAGAVTASASARTRSVADAPVRIAKAGAGRIAYRSVGSGRPLVLVTGLSATMDSWMPSFVDALARRHRVIVFDNAGVGRSTAPRGKLTIAGMARDTASLIRALRLRKPDVLGWSMGGMIAQALARTQPRLVRRLVLCASAPGDGTATLPTPDALAVLGGDYTDTGPLLGLLFPPSRPGWRSRFLAGLFAYPHPEFVAPPAIVRAQLAASADWMLGRDAASGPIGRLRLPVLIGAGALDRALPVANDRRLRAGLPDARLYVYRGAAHGFLFQEQRSFVPLVLRFLR
ncbi:MAG: alpha/beta hydrolase [Solirubrobacteraceae bacterium]